MRKEVWQKAKKWAKVRRHLEEEAQRQLDALAVLGTAALPERDMRQVGAREFSCGSGFFNLIFYCFIVQFNTVGVILFFSYFSIVFVFPSLYIFYIHTSFPYPLFTYSPHHIVSSIFIHVLHFLYLSLRLLLLLIYED